MRTEIHSFTSTPTVVVPTRIGRPLFEGFDEARLDADLEGLNATEDRSHPDWDAIDLVVQQGLRGLAAQIRRNASQVRAVPGRSSGNAFFLYSHMSFGIPTQTDLLAIVAGLDFERHGNAQVLIRAEIVREEEGDLLFRVPSTIVDLDQGQLIAAASRMARQLVETSAPIVVRGLGIEA